MITDPFFVIEYSDKNNSGIEVGLEETMLKPFQVEWKPGAAFNQAVSPHCLVRRSPENMIMRAILKMDHD